MTASNIPDSFNLDELSSLLENAPQEEELHSDNADKEITPEFIEGIANEALQLATERLSDPLVHKVMAMKVMHNMIQWHKAIGEKQFAEGHVACGGAWMRDAGKFQACMDILCSITIGEDDFTCDHE